MSNNDEGVPADAAERTGHDVENESAGTSLPPPRSSGSSGATDNGNTNTRARDGVDDDGVEQIDDGDRSHVPDPSPGTTSVEWSTDGGDGEGGIAGKIRKESAASAALQRSLQAATDPDDCPTHPCDVEGDSPVAKRRDETATTLGRGAHSMPAAVPSSQSVPSASVPPSDDDRKSDPTTRGSDPTTRGSDPTDDPTSDAFDASPEIDDYPSDSDTSVAARKSMDVPVARPVVEDEPRTPVFDPDEVPRAEPVVTSSPQPPPRPWWKRNRIPVGSAAVLSVAAIVAAVAASSVADNSGSGDDGKGDGAVSPASVLRSNPTPSPTGTAVLLNCTVESTGPISEEICDCCTWGVGRDGDTIVTFVSDAWMDPGAYIQELDFVVGPFGLPTHTPEHHIDEIAFSPNYFFASDPAPCDGPRGAVYITARDPVMGALLPGETTRLAPDLEDVDDYSEFGSAMATDGEVLVVGAPYDGGGDGSAFVYRRTTNVATGKDVWSEEAKLFRDGGVSLFGSSVLAMDDGESIVVAARNHGPDNDGAVFFYEFDRSSSPPASPAWRPKMNITNGDCEEEFGASLGLASDGGLLIGCPMGGQDAKGAVYYYRRDGDDGGYSFVQKIEAKDGEGLDKFGGNHHHLALNSDGDVLAVGTDTGAGSLQSSKVYVFFKFGDRWKEMARIVAPEDYDAFGQDVVITRDRILVSSLYNTYSYTMSCLDEDGESEIFL